MRNTLGLLAAFVALPMTAHGQRSSPPPRTFVIVHGAWGGGWDWRAIDSMITLRGNRVVRVTLTGLGERRHLASPQIGLSTHIDDVVNAILWEELDDVILVGHSYGGMVITGTADRIPDRIHGLVYVDAFLPDSGESLIAWADTLGATFIRASLRDGFVVPGWVRDTAAIPRDLPQPFRTFTDTLHLFNPARRLLAATYVLTFEPTVSPDPFQRFADRAEARGWPVHRLHADHTPERSAREPLVALLLAVP